MTLWVTWENKVNEEKSLSSDLEEENANLTFVLVALSFLRVAISLFFSLPIFSLRVNNGRVQKAHLSSLTNLPESRRCIGFMPLFFTSKFMIAPSYTSECLITFFSFFSTFCNGLIIPIIGIVFMKYEWILNVSSKWCVDRMIRALKACRLSFFWEDCDKPSSSWKPKENDVVYPSLLSTEAIERLYVPLFRLHFGSSYLLSPLFQSAKILKIEPLFFPSFSDETTLFPIFFLSFSHQKKKEKFWYFLHRSLM